jgi:serine/threonine-protein kinase
MTLRPDLPQPVGALLEAALAPRPEDRKTDCAAFEKMLARVVRVEVGKGELVRCIQSVHATIELEDAGGQPDRRPTLPVKAKGALLFRAPAGAKVPAEALDGEAQPGEKDGEEPAEEVDVEPDEAGADGPAAGGPAGAPIQFGLPPAAPLGGGVHFGPPPFLPAGVTPLPGGVTPLPGGITPIPGAVPIQFGLPPAIPPAQAPPEGEITQSRSFAQAQRSLVGTIAVSASTATLVAVIWISIAYYRSSPTPDRDATLPPASAPPPVTAPPPPPKPTAVPAPASAAPTAKASVPPEDLDGSSLPAGIGFLTVRFPEPANVYLSGRLMGAANGPLKVRCGQWWVRVAKPVEAKYPEWLSKGMTVNVACQGSTSVNLQPSAGKPR